MNVWKSNATRMLEEQLRNGKKTDGVFTPTKQWEMWAWRQLSSIIICCLRRASKQDKELIENGFEYVTEMDGLKLFRKRK